MRHCSPRLAHRHAETGAKKAQGARGCSGRHARPGLLQHRRHAPEWSESLALPWRWRPPGPAGRQALLPSCRLCSCSALVAAVNVSDRIGPARNGEKTARNSHPVACFGRFLPRCMGLQSCAGAGVRLLILDLIGCSKTERVWDCALSPVHPRSCQDGQEVGAPGLSQQGKLIYSARRGVKGGVGRHQMSSLGRRHRGAPFPSACCRKHGTRGAFRTWRRFGSGSRRPPRRMRS
jgi:hypothetical protein